MTTNFDQWEEIDSLTSRGEYLSRIAVPGGWLVKHEMYTVDTRGDEEIKVSLVYVPDPNWSWQTKATPRR
jgi:hypothetical protein